jgi:TonB family protein
MSQANPSVSTGLRSELGHLAVKVEGLRPDELPFLFERQSKRMSNALAGSIGVHALVAVFAILMTLYGPSPQISRPAQPDKLPKEIVWLNVPGPGGGGGGGGNQMKEPPRKAELPGKDKITVPAVKQPDVKPTPKQPEPPKQEQELTIPAKVLGDSQQPLPGVVEGVNADLTVSQGTGTGGGAGTGQGSGVGPGQGSGLGPGYGGGTGGGAYRPGNGVELPRVIREVRPNYTADAMRAKVQGTVWVEAVVLPDGTVGQVQVVRSLDNVFGLDQEALRAAKQWKFAPGTRFGQPVPVLVTIELTFTLR